MYFACWVMSVALHIVHCTKTLFFTVVQVRSSAWGSNVLIAIFSCHLTVSSQFFLESHLYHFYVVHRRICWLPGKYGLRFDGDRRCLRSYHPRVANGGETGGFCCRIGNTSKLVKLYNFTQICIFCVYIYIHKDVYKNVSQIEHLLGRVKKLNGFI